MFYVIYYHRLSKFIPYKVTRNKEYKDRTFINYYGKTLCKHKWFLYISPEIKVYWIENEDTVKFLNGSKNKELMKLYEIPRII